MSKIPWYCYTQHQHCTYVIPQHTRQHLKKNFLALLVDNMGNSFQLHDRVGFFNLFISASHPQDIKSPPKLVRNII